MEPITRSFSAIAIRAALTAAATAAVCSCGSGPQSPAESSPVSARAAAATAAQSAGRAIDLERNAALTRSFARIQWLEEALLEHQWLLDHHPESPLVVNARDRMAEVREEIFLLKEWKKRFDEFEKRAMEIASRPEHLPQARIAAAEISASPFPFAAEAARKRLDKLESAAHEAVAASLEKVIRRSSDATSRGDWNAAYCAFGALDQAHAGLFPALAARLDEERTRVSDAALAQAEQTMRAASGHAGKGDHETALRLTIGMLSSYEGLPFHGEISEFDARMRDDARDRVLSERRIPGSPAPEGIARPPARPRGSAVEAVPGTARERAVAALLADPVIEETPEPGAMFDGSASPLATADSWYYKAVALEIRAMPGDRDRKKLLAAAATSYTKIRAAYVHLLAVNRKPDKALEERMSLAKKAAAWCRKLESAEHE